MQLSIITINKNNSIGLKDTIGSVINVKNRSIVDFEHMIIDGESIDDSVDIITNYANDCGWVGFLSEADSGIYNAMNKGVRIARGEFLLFLNSGDQLLDIDVLICPEVCERDIIYGNMLLPGNKYIPVDEISIINFGLLRRKYLIFLIL